MRQHKRFIIIVSSILLIIVSVILVKVKTAKPTIKYIEFSSELKGERLALPTKSRAIDTIAFGDGVFVGAGESVLGHSTNGSDWDFYMDQDSSSHLLNDVIYADGRFVAVGNGIIMSSPNGIDWEEFDIGQENNLHSVAYGNGKFVAVGMVGVFTSEDGIAWTHDRSNLYWTMFWSICFGNDYFVAVGPYTVAYSKDGARWGLKSIPYDKGMGYLTSVACSNGKYIALGGLDSHGSTIWSSENAQDWHPIAKVRDLAFEGNVIDNQFFFTGNRGLLYSKDGVDWDYLQAPQGMELEDVAFGNGQYLFTGLTYWDGNSPVPSAPILIKKKHDFAP
ncbi:hypothetical protein EBB07_21315 [Paenibacillaceae bacterium]|nr:hypothetical protein EBB07_21315 [Paenibacillaceae bacterium]